MAMRLSGCRDSLLADYRLQGRSSAPRVRSVFRAFEEFCGGDIYLDAVTPDLLARFAAQRLETRARGTVRLELGILRRGWVVAQRLGSVERIPAFPRVKPSPPRRGFFEREELERVLRGLSPEVAAAVECLYLTGWRKSEVLGLRWERVDWEGGTIRLDTSKSGRGRVFPFAALPPLAELLREQRIRCELLGRLLRRVVPWVFPALSGGPIRSFRTQWATACRRAGCPGRLVHDLRRTAVRNLERAGVPRSVAMALTGHLTERVYTAYAIVDERDLAAGVERLARIVLSARCTDSTK